MYNEAEGRWLFLYGDARPRFTLHLPDLCCLQWSVYDRHEKRTYALGDSAAQAVDAAMDRYTSERISQHPPLPVDSLS
jgi:hypothetical protein